MIRKWHLKAVIQKTISFLPYSQKFNYFFQKYVTKGLHMTNDLFYDRLGHAITHLEAYEKHSDGKPLRSTLELGTGWYPIVPFAMYLYGADEVTTTDIDRLCTASQCLTTMRMYVQKYDTGQLPDLLMKNPQRMDVFRSLIAREAEPSFAEIQEALHFRYEVLDMSKSQEQLGKFDLVTSNNTFEHVYPEVLKQIIHELSSRTRKGGVMSHFIDLSDHYAHMDSSINIYHFLRYSDNQWRLIDNSVQPMNRYRMPDYRALYQSLGIAINEEINRPGSLEMLSTIPLAAKYQVNPPSENAISHSLVISRIG